MYKSRFFLEQKEKQKLLAKNDEQDYLSINSDGLPKHAPFADVDDVKPEEPSFIRKLSQGTTAVYIWNSANQGGAGVGHIAIAFNDGSEEEKYVSYWPKEKVKNPLTGKVQGRWASKEEDLQQEGRPPDYMIELTSLDVRKMAAKLEEIKKIASKWYAFASTPLNKAPDSLNCISVAIEILRAGDIEERAGEQIIKLKPDEYDKGVLPYRRTSSDNYFKGSLSCCSGCIRVCLCLFCCLSMIVIAPFFFCYAIVGNITGGPIIGKYFKIMDKLPKSVDIIISILMVISVIGCLYSFYKQKCINKKMMILEFLFQIGRILKS